MLALVVFLAWGQPAGLSSVKGYPGPIEDGDAAGPAQVGPSITYVPGTRTIEVKGPGAAVRLTDVYEALRDDALLQRLGPFEWLLKVNLKGYEQVRLEFHGQAAGGDVDWLKLRSEPSGYATIESSNGQISIRNTRITSWDPAAGTFDTAFLDGSGRAFVAAKNRRATFVDNRMDVVDSEVAYLGFFEETAYGISWKVISETGTGDTGILGKGMTGAVTGSRFHHNYFGLYVWGVGDMVVTNNEFYENYGYGFDAHTVTQRTTLEDNYAHDNGLHGIIFADRCTENVVRRNRSVNNKGHGIMLHEASDYNVIEDNVVTGNDDGIPLFESSDNVIRDNVVRDNATGVRVYGRASPSARNLFEDNEIAGSRSYGVFMYDAAVDNIFRSNSILSSGDAGVYGKTIANNVFTGNTIQDNLYGVRLDSTDTREFSTGNQVRGNTIAGSRQYGVYSYAPPAANKVEDNQFVGNRLGDTEYPGASVVRGPGSQVLRLLRLGLFAAIVVAAIVTGVIVLVRKRASARS